MNKSTPATATHRTAAIHLRQPASRRLPGLVLVRLALVATLVFSLWGPLRPDFSFATDGTGSIERSETLLCATDSPLWHYYLWRTLFHSLAADPDQKQVLFAYQTRNWRPLFLGSDFRLSADAASLMDRLKQTKSEAIDPAPYHLEELQKHLAAVEQLRASVRCGDPSPRQGLLQPVVQHTPAAAFGAGLDPQGDIPARVLQPPALAPGMGLDEKEREIFQHACAADIALIKDLIRYTNEMNPFASQELSRAICGEISVAELLPQLEPNSPRYALIRQTLAKYRQLASAKPFQTLDLPKLQLGDKGSAVRHLQDRLAQEGFFQGKVDGRFDQATKQAVEKFQLAHQVEADGVIGDQTKARLNEPYEEKVKMLALSLKLLRESPTRRYDRFVRINIPQFTLEYYKGGKLNDSYRVILGKAAGKKVKLQGRMIGVNQTPTLISAIQQVIFNPRWYVSDRIRLELDDALRADPDYFSRNGYVAMSSSYPWGQPRLYQRPGPNNPLGQVKFEFPNSYAVFLHDTPKKQLFLKTRRDFSHGCIRLNKAVDFAQALLTDEGNPIVKKVDQYLAGDRQVYVKLTQPVPIAIEYVPVSTDASGQVVFCGDPYGWLTGVSADYTLLLPREKKSL